MKILIAGGNKKTVTLIDALEKVKDVKLVGVCDKSLKSKGAIYAARKGIYTSNNLVSSIKEKAPDIIIEASKTEALQKIAKQNKKQKIQIINVKEAQLLFSVAEKELSLFAEKEKLKKDLMEAENELSSLFQGMEEGLLLLNKKKEILFVNPAAKIIFNIKENSIGKKLSGLMRDKSFLGLEAEISLEKKFLAREMKFALNNLKKVVKFYITPTYSHFGWPSGWLVLIADVTKEKESERVKSEFISTVSHELRTPLAAIKEAVMLTFDGTIGTVSPQQDRFLNIAKKNIDRLTNLINNLLDIAKIEAGKMKLQKSSCNIEKIIKNSIDNFMKAARENELLLTQEIEKNLPWISCDIGKISQALNNLIENAVKFTQAGGRIEVKAVKYLKSGKKEFVKISVKDTGMGIEGKNVKKLFTRFWQVDSSLTRKPGGAGLGLVICKNIIELHDGELWAESKKGKGSEFSFILPVEEED